jgi:hypothetical protein
LTAAPRGAGGIPVGTKKRPAVKQRNECELDFDAAIRERMITSSYEGIEVKLRFLAPGELRF